MLKRDNGKLKEKSYEVGCNTIRQKERGKQQSKMKCS